MVEHYSMCFESDDPKNDLFKSQKSSNFDNFLEELINHPLYADVGLNQLVSQTLNLFK